MVRWARHSDGKCHGQEYYDAEPGCKKSLLALAAQISIKGHVSKQPENGHRLRPPFDDLYELKPGDHRFMGFRVGRDFYITNGAPKKENQDADYRVARKIRNAVRETLDLE